MNILIQQGKVLYWGTSEWSAQEIMEAHHLAERHHLIPPCVEQPQYNLFHRERFEKEYRMLFQRYGMGSTIWSPLASGILTGKYNHGIPKSARLARAEMAGLHRKIFGNNPDEKFRKTELLGKLARQAGMTLPQLAIAWCLKNENVSTVLLGASKLQQLDENLGTVEILPMLTEQVMQSIEEIVLNKPHISMF
jgi:aryl-alcohol dehydrogenase-like predicted oxidoreductase